MSKYPAGFLSYVRADDEHDRGKLTEFRKRLSGEVYAQAGVRFDIFQDKLHLAWGDHWRERINDSLDSGTFLICIITPRFFMSDACREEVERFAERERMLGRTDLILPVYYIDCPLLNDPVRRAADPVARLIGARNYADWRDLRFDPLDDSEVQRAMARLAADIVRALETRFAPAVADARRKLDLDTVS